MRSTAVSSQQLAVSKKAAFSFGNRANRCVRPAQAKIGLEWGTLDWAFGNAAIGCVLAVGLSAAAQSGVPVPATNPNAAIPKALVPYTTCGFPDGLRIGTVEPLAEGLSSRPVQTAQGTEQIELEAGERVMFQYPLTDFFADAKVELLPAGRYAQFKETLLSNLHFLESERGGPTPARALPVGLHGFEVHGNDRQKLEGNVVGMYVLFDDPMHVATTVYFLNQESWQRKFQTMDEYGRLRDNFLRVYTGCVRENQALAR